jgi:ribonucleoside-diphosphate reductase alpha chain
MSNGTKVVKRNGLIESLDLDKMHLMVEEACKGLAGVSASQVEMTSGIQFYSGISTQEIQEILIRSASDLIDLDHPNYQFVAARLLLFSVRKQLYGKMKELPPLEQHIYQCANHEVYDKDIFNKYSKEEIERADSYIDHDRDYLFTYAGLRQVVDKYLVQDRSGGGVYETPQFMYMMIALTVFAEYPKETSLSYVKRYYDAISKAQNQHSDTHHGRRQNPTSSICILCSWLMLMTPSTASSAAIWLLAGMFLTEGWYWYQRRSHPGYQFSKIRGGEVQHTGVVPFLKKFESTVRCCTQNGIRGGSATVHFPIWHQEIEDILVLKNNKGTEDNRVRKLDYSQFRLSKIFYERFIQDGEITLVLPT